MSDDRVRAERELASATFQVPDIDDIVAAIRDRDALVAQRAFKEGFKKGWSEAFKQIQELASKKAEGGAVKTLSPNVDVGDGTVIMKEMDGTKLKTYHLGERPIGTKEIVRRFISRQPGLRGVDLVSRIASEGFDLHERTIRTALHRLKIADEIRVVDGRWYTRDSVPPDPLSLSLEEDDDAAAS